LATDPIRPTDDQARALARALIKSATFAALGVLIDDVPHVTRIAITTDEAGNPVTLVSDLSHHTQAMRADPRVSLLLGEPGDKGDPLTHPRLTLQARADFLNKTAAQRARYLKQYPKAKLYIDFVDFHLVRLVPEKAFLNGGFGRAFHLNADDLGRTTDHT
jgi:putative heme iron utilization protein